MAGASDVPGAWSAGSMAADVASEGLVACLLRLATLRYVARSAVAREEFSWSVQCAGCAAKMEECAAGRAVVGIRLPGPASRAARLR